MGVDCELLTFVGLKKDYIYLNHFYKNRSDECYKYDLEDGTINKDTKVIFTDYLPDGYIIETDGMCGEYSLIGKKLKESIEDIYDGFDLSIDPSTLQKIKEEVIQDLRGLGLEFQDEEVKLHCFTHFS